MPWAIAGAGVAAAGSLGGAAMQSAATGKAAGAAAQDQRIAYQVAQNQLEPYRNIGGFALDRIGELTGQYGERGRDAFYNAFREDPGYRFAVSEGLRGVDAGAAAGHMLDSGATRRAEITLGENLANQQFGQYVNRLYALAGAGQNSATQTATSALNTGTNLGNIAMGQGAADASIYGNAGKGIGSAVNTLFGNQDFRNWLNSGSGGSSIYPSGNVTGPNNNMGLLSGATNVGGNTWYGGSGPANSLIYSPTEISAAGGWY